jgi:hypothetical protein
MRWWWCRWRAPSKKLAPAVDRSWRLPWQTLAILHFLHFHLRTLLCTITKHSASHRAFGMKLLGAMCIDVWMHLIVTQLAQQSLAPSGSSTSPSGASHVFAFCVGLVHATVKYFVLLLQEQFRAFIVHARSLSETFTDSVTPCAPHSHLECIRFPSHSPAQEPSS